MSARVFVALDVPTLDEAATLAAKVSHAAALKIGLELFAAHGPEAVRALGDAEIFLDLKFHDIPTTVARAIRSIGNLGVAYVNVHALGGRAMMEAAAAAKGSTALLGVTILTSMDDAALAELGLPPAAEAVPHLASLARASGCDGVVCAPTDIAAVRAVCPPPFQIVTPGVRPAGASADDQVRIMTPSAAIAAGADRLVIGRPVTRAPDPRAAIDAINEELG